MKRELKKELSVIAVSMTIYIVNRIFKYKIDMPVIGYLCRCHLNDFIGGIVFTGYVNLLLESGNRKPLRKLRQILLLMLIAGISWEYVIPVFIHRGTADFYDIIAYELGGLLYWEIFRDRKHMFRKLLF